MGSFVEHFWRRAASSSAIHFIQEVGTRSHSMEKRLFIAVVASIAFLWIWAALVPLIFPDLAKRKPVPAKGAATATAPPAATPVSKSAPPAAATVPQLASVPAVAVVVRRADAESQATVETPLYVARFSNRGAQLVSFRLKGYHGNDGELVELVKDRPVSSTDYPFAVETAETRVTSLLNQGLYTLDRRTEGNKEILEFHYADRGVSMRKVFRLAETFAFDFEVMLEAPAVAFRVMIGPGLRPLSPNEKDNQFVITGDAIIQRGGSLDRTARAKAPKFEIFEGPLDFIGIEDSYFLTSLQPRSAAEGILRRIEIPPAAKGADVRKEIFVGLNAKAGEIAGTAFFGPKQAAILEAHGLEKTLQFGWFGLIARFLLTALMWINNMTHNYGWAIVVLTIIIKILLYPLQHKSIVSMKKMQKAQPKMNAIRERFKKAKSDAEQRQKMNTEMMKLYQQEGISPMGGCLPLLLQLPILWGFFGLLSKSIELRGAPFILWIHDLSAKDPYYLLPILMTVTMFIQTAITPSTADPTQKKIFLMMPFIMGWVFKEFPSGLVLYWFVQNILTIIQQLIMNRYWKEHPEA